MPSNRRLFLNNTMVMASARTEEGLPFLPLNFMNEIIWSNLAKAQKLYGQRVSAVLVEANQFHLILKVGDPESLAKFIGYFKQETAHAINRLLGRRRKTIWVGDYDAPTILDLKRFLQAYAYAILNPVKDKQAATLDEFNGVSSWEMLKRLVTTRRCKRIARNKIPRVRNPYNPRREANQILTFINERNTEEIDFELDLFSWKTCFPETQNLSDAELHKMIMQAIDDERCRLSSMAQGQTKRLQRKEDESLLKPYRPKKFSPKSICLSSVGELRTQFIKMFRALCLKARKIYEEWLMGDLTQKMPPGIFAPAMPRLANCLTSAVW